MLSCNIISYREEHITTQLKQVSGYFDKIRVLNSNFSFDRIKKICSRFDVDYYERSFDTPANQFSYIMSKASVGEWYLYLSDDEIPSTPLLENLYPIIDYCVSKDIESVCFPFINVRDYLPTFSDHTKTGFMLAYADKDIADKYGINIEFQWSTLRMLKINDNLKFRNAVHGELIGYKIPVYVSEYPILHYKPIDGFIVSALWQAVLDDVGDVPIKIKQELLSALKDSNIELNSDSIIGALKNGNVSQSLKDWMWKYKDDKRYIVYSWFMYYYLYCYSEELPKDFYDKRLLNNFKNEILGNDIELNVMFTRLNRYMKEYFLSRGIVVLRKSVEV